MTHAAPSFWRRLAGRAVICLGYCLVVALVPVVVVDDWRGPLLASMTVGGICWLCVDTSRATLCAWRWRRLGCSPDDPGPAPDGTYRAWPGWPWMIALAFVGACAGVAGSQWLMGALGLTAGPLPNGDTWPTRDPRVIGSTVLLSVGVTMLISHILYMREHALLSHQRAEAAHRAALETQLRLLQAQLEPHMLFNTLANLHALIALDATKAQGMLDHLVAFLRTTLQASRQAWHSLEDEFAHVADYLALMQVRMGHRLQVDIDLAESVRHVRVPPLLLQPLVENAIVHGLEPMAQGGSLSLRAWAEDGRVHVAIRDTGRGLVRDEDDGSRVGTDYGLQHVRDRLHAHWGEQGQLTLSPAPGGGTLALVRLPCPQTMAAITEKAP